MKQRNNQIIVALDNDIDEGMMLVKKIEEDSELNEKIYGYKVGSLWILQKGLEVVEELYYGLELDINIIVDAQKWPTDIPDIVKRQVAEVAKTGAVSELIACPMGGGKKSLEAFVEACKDGGIRPLCVLEMTHPQSDSYLKYDAWMDILRDGVELGIDGFIIPATKEPRQAIKDYLAENLPSAELYTTGYKVQGGQAQPMVEFGVTKFVIGRAIYDAHKEYPALSRTDAVKKAITDIYEEIKYEEIK